MAKIDLEILIRKLDLDTRQILEQAIGNAVSRGNFDVEVEHLVFSLIISKNEDLKDIMNMFDMKQARLQKDLLNHIEKFRTGNVRRICCKIAGVDVWDIFTRAAAVSKRLIALSGKCLDGM